VLEVLKVQLCLRKVKLLKSRLKEKVPKKKLLRQRIKRTVNEKLKLLKGRAIKQLVLIQQKNQVKNLPQNKRLARKRVRNLNQRVVIDLSQNLKEAFSVHN